MKCECEEKYKLLEKRLDALEAEMRGKSANNSIAVIKPTGVAEIIDYLNYKTGSKFRPVATHVKLIKARIAEGYTLEDIKDVIDRKVQEWPPGHEMRGYLRPATLLNAEKFSNYHGQLNQPIPEQSNGQPRQDRDQRIIDRLNHTRDYARATDF